MRRNLVLLLAGAAIATGLSMHNAVQTGQALAASQSETGRPLRVQSITPRGNDVAPGRQIVFQFDRKVVPVGRMERTDEEIPITIQPPLDCEWRWINTSALACQLGERDTFRPATRYEITVRPGIETEDGTTFAEPVQHFFETERPKVTGRSFHNWQSPGTPRFRVTFNQQMAAEVVTSKLYFSVANERFAVAAEIANQNADQPSRHWVVWPTRELPLDSEAALFLDDGATSLEGPLGSMTTESIVSVFTFPKHRFVGVRCHDNDGKEITLRPDYTSYPARLCNPLGYVALVFASPVVKETLKAHLGVEPDLAGGRDDYDPWDQTYSYSQLHYARRKDQMYSMRFPELLRARTTYHVRAAASELLDEFGRPLTEDIDFMFTTNDRPPRAVLTHGVTTLEKDVETHVPIVVTNLEKLRVNVTAVTTDGVSSFVKTVPIPPAPNVAFRFPLESRDWLSGKSGALFGSVIPTPSVPHWLGRFFSQITPFAVHVKMGHQNTAVWVTDMKSGDVVSDARVSIYSSNPAAGLPPGETLAETATDVNGVAFLPGAREINPKLDVSRWEGINATHSGDPIFFVRVEKGSEMALAPLSYDFWLQAEGVNDTWIPTDQQKKYGHIRTWGTTAQGVYRAGDTVQYKLYVRDQSNEQFIPAPRKTYVLTVTDPAGKRVHEVKDIELNDFGAHDGELTIAQNGAVGWYDFTLTADFHPGYEWAPLRVLVADFTPAPFRVTTDLNGDAFEPEGELRVATSAKLHAGGPYADAESRVTVRLTPSWVSSNNPKAAGFYFGGGAYGSTETLHESEAPVDNLGELQTTFTIPDRGFVRGRLSVESAVRDDRGKYVAGFASASYVGRDRVVGVRQEDWLLQEDEETSFEAIVIDDNDEIVTGVEMLFRARFRETTASRVKGAGNAYITQYNHRWVDITTCSEISTPEPQRCSFTPDEPGRYELIVSINDTKGRAHATTLSRWARGKGRVLWQTPPGHRLDIEPEKAEYEVGDTARFLVRNPFPGAKALITTERYGIQKHWLQELEGNTPVIEIPVVEDHVPGFYFSVVVTAPRVEAPPAERDDGNDGDVDLGKPAFRMGYVQVPVRDPYKEILVDVQPAGETYKPRDRVTVNFSAKPRHPKPGSDPKMELAVAVLDEAVFDLIGQGKSYFDPYRGFYVLEPLDVSNFNVLTRLIGIQKFEKKGANAGGGGGGGADLRSLFKFVSYWNPSIELDENGKASVEFDVPDNLTGWRVLAMAVTADDLMGLGEGNFVVNKPTEIRPAIPNQVTEGDRFDARFTVMNRTDEKRTITVRASVEGPADSPGVDGLVIEAEPYQRYPVSFPVRALTSGVLTFRISAGDVIDGDSLSTPLEVRKMSALEVAATYGTTTEANTIESFLFPENMRTDVGRVSLVASPSVLGNVEGAFSYMRDYPYACWEQKLTKAIMASHFPRLRAYVSDGFEWSGHQAIPDQTLALATNHQAPNGGMVYWTPRDAYVSPYLSAYTALAFRWLRERGHGIPGGVESKLHTYLLNFLRKDVSPDFYSEGMSSTVRAVALAALALSGALEPAELERYRPHVERMDLFGKAHFLMAADALGAETTTVRDNILSHANQTGGKFVFTEAVDASYQRILHSAERTQCAILSALTREQDDAPSGSGIGDVPFRLTRTITQSRKRRDHWENTQENIFCMNALVDYSQVYEKESPDYTLRTYFDNEEIGSSEFTDLRDEAVEHVRSIQPDDPGKRGEMRLSKLGPGRLYYAARLFYSPKELKTDRVNSGMEVRREYSVQRGGSWTLLTQPMRIRRGELVRVDLYVSLPAARNFVVVDDPIPGGLEPVNRDLATASAVDADEGNFQGSDAAFWWTRDDWFGYGYSRWSFYHKELRHSAARFFSDYLPAGNYHLSYTAQAIAEGTFQVLPTHAEEMYDPDVFGQGLPATLTVESAGGSGAGQ